MGKCESDESVVDICSCIDLKRSDQISVTEQRGMRLQGKQWRGIEKGKHVLLTNGRHSSNRIGLDLSGVDRAPARAGCESDVRYRGQKAKGEAGTIRCAYY